MRYGLAVDSSTEGRRTTEDTLLMGDTESELLHNAEEFFKACDINEIVIIDENIHKNAMCGYKITVLKQTKIQKQQHQSQQKQT